MLLLRGRPWQHVKETGIQIQILSRLTPPPLEEGHSSMLDAYNRYKPSAASLLRLSKKARVEC